MKQRITTEQLQELTSSQTEKVRRLNEALNYTVQNIKKNVEFPLLTLGQMLQFLRKDIKEITMADDCVIGIFLKNGEKYKGEEVCDILWEITKTKIKKTSLNRIIKKYAKNT